MTTAEMIKELCEQMNISVSELARRVGQTPQNFSKKLKRETVSLDELKVIADVLGIKFEQAFILPDGNEIKTGNKEVEDE
ncbi:helix-turn-helix domain-containing protein [Lapidilactobacillus luobeiensis]|uniref:helix-turn-helix domain-containing protein n=1 Tax=Lapidilactobacillus luobeiensis TaxID=2950371 RepID=UPI0021C4B57E|nr:helix-turn-helix transcriptional regulator [Lapidilactobacillus luobeiensis]